MQGDELNLLALLKLGQSVEPPGKDIRIINYYIFPEE